MKSSFAVYDDAVRALFGPAPRLELLHENAAYPFAHEAGVFIERSNTLIVTSNQFVPDESDCDSQTASTGGKTVVITRVHLPPAGAAATAAVCEPLAPPADVLMPNGGVNYGDGVLLCSQGSRAVGGALVYMAAAPPYATHTLLRSFYGRAFNSPNDVVVRRSDGSVWFTDPAYGFEQGIRGAPQLPSQVYRFDPASGGVRAVADGLGRPNGLCFSPDEATLYVTDTAGVHGDGRRDAARAATIYAYDVAHYGGQPFLTNKRLFAMADAGVPDGIKCDVAGNVWSGCGDGVHVWSAGGVLLGKVLVVGGAANLCFGRGGELYILGEHRLYRATLAATTRGALLG